MVAGPLRWILRSILHRLKRNKAAQRRQSLHRSRIVICWRVVRMIVGGRFAGRGAAGWGKGKNETCSWGSLSQCDMHLDGSLWV
jgi:hypothetical protein